MPGACKSFADTQLAEKLAARAGMFRQFLTDPQVLSSADADAWLGALLSHGQLALADYQELLWADALVRGRRNGQNGYLVVEASWTVGPKDVDRARRRATLLRERAGVPAWPVVAGYRVSQEAARLLASEGVLHLALPD
ncbi:MAG: hypothetical protein HY332_15175 [Chloroflexi bacterium]|nr:hypothetical protein [Chloroflexota bacterium]